MNYESDEAYEADHFHEVNRYEADPVSATIAAMAKPPIDADREVQRIPLENREYAAARLARDNREIAERMERMRERERAAAERKSIAAEMVTDIYAQLQFLNSELGGDHDIADKDLLDRARNVVANVLGNWDVRRWP